MAFLESQKTFDNIKKNNLFKVLREISLKYKDRRTTLNLYKNQPDPIQVGDE